MSSTLNTLLESEERSSNEIKLNENDNIISFSVNAETDSQKSILPGDLTKVISEDQENLSILDINVKNMNALPLNTKIDECDMEDKSLGGKSDICLETGNSDKDDDLELRYEDDELDDEDELINEDALLEDNIELEDDISNKHDEKEVILELKKVHDRTDVEIGDGKNLTGTQPDEPLAIEQDIENQNKIEVHKDVRTVVEKREVCVNTLNNKSESSISTLNEINSLTHTAFEPITEHGLNKPDMMLDIPTQELIEFSDEDDDDDIEYDLKLSSDIEDVMDLEGSSFVKDNLINIPVKQVSDTEDDIISSANIDNSSLANTNTSIGNAHTSDHKSCKDINMDVMNNQSAQNDINTNALSYEAEIAADIITKEMNAMDDEPTFVDTNSIEEDLLDEENETLAEELINQKSEGINQDASQLMDVDHENTDIIDISDDNIENETEDMKFDSDNTINSLPDTCLYNKSTLLENEMRLAIMEEDILNDVREIDDHILSKKISKTRVTEEETKVITIKYDKNIPDQNLPMNALQKSFETKEVDVSNQYANEIDTVGKINDMVTLDKKQTTTDSQKTLDSLITDELSKQPDIELDATVEVIKGVETLNSLQQSPCSLNTSEICQSHQDKSINSELSQENSSQPNMTDLLLPAHTESDLRQHSSFDIEEQITKNVQTVKSVTELEPLIIEHSESPTSNAALGTFEINEIIPSTSKIEPVNINMDGLETSSSKLELMGNPESSMLPKVLDTSIKPISRDQESMEINSDPKPSTSKLAIKILSNEEPIPSTSKVINPISSEMVTPQSPSISELKTLDPKPNSPKNQPMFLGHDSSNDVPEMTDSLGLLAESSRVMEDDEDHDYYDDGEDEDDFDHYDESSNQMTAEHSEDSNAHHSESDVPKDSVTPNAEKKQAFDFTTAASTASVSNNTPENLECDLTNVEGNLEEAQSAVNNEAPEQDISENKAEEMEVDTVKLSDTSDTEDNGKKKGDSVLKALLLDGVSRKSTDSNNASWNKTKNLSISKQRSVMTFVDLEESSSDDAGNMSGNKLDLRKKSVDSNNSSRNNIRELSLSTLEHVMNIVDLEENSSDDDKNQAPTNETTVETNEAQPDATSKTTSKDITSNNTTEVANETESNRSGSPEPAPVIAAKSKEIVADKSPSDSETTAALSSETKLKSPVGLEVFNLDSDEDDSSEKQIPETAVTEEIITEQSKLHETVKCINRSCTNVDASVGYYIADTNAAIYFEVDKKKRGYICKKCAEIVDKRNQDLVDGIKNFTSLLSLHIPRSTEELVEILDSESDDEPEPDPNEPQLVGKEVAMMLENKLADLFNETWKNYNMDARIADAEKAFQKSIDKLKVASEEIDTVLKECQATTDKLRNSLYASFDPEIKELPAIIIYDMPNCSYTSMEQPAHERRSLKRRLSTSKDVETSQKKPTTSGPVDCSDQLPKPDQEAKSPVVEKFDDDNTDISVVKLSAESAPADLPPPGDLFHPPIKVGMTVYAMKNAFGTWLRAKVVEIHPKSHTSPFTVCRVRFEHKVTKNPFKTLQARCLAYFEPPEVRMTIGTRVIALFKDISSRQAFYSGIVAEIPNPVNNYRYLIFFDDGYAQYAPHSQTRLVCECSSLVWEEVHPYSREFVRGYLIAYPERPMVRLHAGQNLKTEWRGKWWSSRVVNVDASLVEVQFLRCDRREWIYRGSTRLAPLYLELQAAERHRPRALPRAQPQSRTNMPYVEYTRSDEQANKQIETNDKRQQHVQEQQEETRRQRSVAKKSTAASQAPAQENTDNLDNVTSRVVHYKPKNAVKPYKMMPHTCSEYCKRFDVLALKNLRTYNPLAKPLLSGWERQIVRWKGQKEVMYVSPCGRRLRNMKELHRYLRSTESDMPVDLFDFSPNTHCLAEFVLNKCFVAKKDLSHGKENVPVPCVNYYDESLPEFCSYNTERTPTAGVPLNLDPEFLCGCDCDDDCEDKSKCGCWKMTQEGAKTIGYEGDVGYVYRRLPEPLPSGIYECNSRCKCKYTCLNRVAQHPLQLKLQVFKTLNRGWGIRALNDVPKGSFLCVYAGNLLTDATANLDGLNEGDEYLAELDYIEVVEQMKEGYEEDIPEKTKPLSKKELKKDLFEGEEDEESSEEEICTKRNEEEDDDFQPGYIGLGVARFSKRLRRRDSKKESEETKQPGKEKEKESNPDGECITISDDEEVREPSCFTAAAGMGANEFISKYRSVRTLFGEDEACYIMDAKVQGNIGRYLNHSCTPNVFVQNVFVDTHDPRFPWVAFFALNHIRAGTELTWNYNYDVGSVPGKVLYCFCGAQNCRGRLL